MPATPDAERAGAPADAAALMDLEQLAEVSGVAPRTIRFYQTKKVLPPPAKDPSDARLARYGAEHAERLRLIGELQDRGLKLPAIKDLFDQKDAGVRVENWLGLDEARGSWVPASPRLVERDELARMLAGTPRGTKGQLEGARMIARQANAWLIHNPPLLDLVIGLIRDGVRTDLVLEAGAILHRQLGKAADQLIDLFARALSEGFGGGSDTRTLVDTLRPVAGDAAQLMFGQQLERAIDTLLADTKRLGKR